MQARELVVPHLLTLPNIDFDARKKSRRDLFVFACVAGIYVNSRLLGNRVRKGSTSLNFSHIFFTFSDRSLLGMETMFRTSMFESRP